MKIKKIILISLLAIIVILILFNIFLGQRTYTDEKYGYSFKYPRSWGVEKIEGEYNTKIDFYDRSGESVLNLQNPYRHFKQEIGTFIQSSTYSTNDPGTILNYEEYEGWAPSQSDTILVTWQKGCLDGSCNMTEDSGGYMMIFLSEDEKAREKQIKELDDIIKSFKVIND